MKVIEVGKEIICSKVKVIFQHPNGYTTVMQREDNFIYLYDEKVMSHIGVSLIPFPQTITLVAFAKNYGKFYTYLTGNNLSSALSNSPYLICFQINENSKLEAAKIVFTNNNLHIKPIYQSITTFQITDGSQNNIQVLVCFDSTSCNYVNSQGEILQQFPLILENESIKSYKTYPIKQNIFLLTESGNLMQTTLRSNNIELKQQLKWQEKIQSIFIDNLVHKRYIGVLTEDQVLHIVNISHGQYKIYHSFNSSSFLIKQLTFLYPGVNTNSRNKLKDLVYIAFQSSTSRTDRSIDRDGKKNSQNTLNISNLHIKNLQVYEYRQMTINNSPSKLKLKQTNHFQVENIGTIKAIFFNEHQYNCIRVMNEENHLISLNMISMLDKNRLDEQWVYLCYQFQQCPNNQSFFYEAKEQEFDNQFCIRKNREISEQELNDWSFSCFTIEEMKDLKKRKLRCLNFH